MPGLAVTALPDGRATLKDVALAARVHPATASRALRDGTRYMVGEQARQRVAEAARSLGYVPNQVAASLRVKRTHTIGMLIGDLAGPQLLPLLQGAEEALREAGYMMLAASAAAGTNGPGPVDGMLARRADGIIIAGGQARLAAAAVAAGLPVVTAGYACASLPSAAPDLAVAADLAAGHLASMGHRTVACISSPAAPLPRHLLEAAARRAGLTVPGPLTADTPSVSAGEGQRCCHAMLASGAAFTAVLTGSDILAAGCCQALAAGTRSCPGAVSVTGAGDLPLAGSLAPPLTTIRLHEHAVGASAARLLLARLHDGDSAPVETMQLAPAFVFRGSTAAPPQA